MQKRHKSHFSKIEFGAVAKQVIYAESRAVVSFAAKRTQVLLSITLAERRLQVT